MSRSRHFRFKQFTIDHAGATHPVGTDGVLLGAWASVNGSKTVLDIGTGSGLIALMIAQRTSADVRIDAIDVEETNVNSARQNVQSSPWAHQVYVHHIALQDFTPDMNYDLIITNPPYFINSSLPPESSRARARHTQSLPFSDIIQFALTYLTPSGRLAIVLPIVEGSIFAEQAMTVGLFESRRCVFHARADKPAERLFMEFTRTKTERAENSLYLYGAGDVWSHAHNELTKDFYLKL